MLTWGSGGSAQIPIDFEIIERLCIFGQPPPLPTLCHTAEYFLWPAHCSFQLTSPSWRGGEKREELSEGERGGRRKEGESAPPRLLCRAIARRLQNRRACELCIMKMIEGKRPGRHVSVPQQQPPVSASRCAIRS